MITHINNGISNLLEFAFGTNPVTSTAAALQYNGTLAGGGTITATGQPKMVFESIPTGVDFRALFVRRNDYVAAGLTYTVQFSPERRAAHGAGQQRHPPDCQRAVSRLPERQEGPLLPRAGDDLSLTPLPP